jgi:hypothetical protein
MAWGHDPQKVRDQMGEFGRFIDHVRAGGPPAGIHDIFGRPFRYPEPSQPPMQIPPSPVIENNYYQLQLAHLYEAGLINQHVVQNAMTQINGQA